MTSAGLSGSSVLVTGGAGFIGTRLVHLLLEEGAQVTVIDDFSSPSSSPPPAAATVHRLHLPNPALAEIVADGRFAMVFHLAGAAYVPPSIDDPVIDLSSNAEVTLSVLEAVRHAAPRARLIFTSSAAVYGSPEILPIGEDTPIAPVSPYGVSKFAAEQYVSLYARLHGLHTAALRLFSVYGPGQRKQVIYDLVAKMRANSRVLPVHGTGDETRDFVYVDDVAHAAILVATCAPLAGEVYNVASGTSVSIRHLVEVTAEALGLAPEIRFTGEVRPGDALRWEADNSRLRALGFAPEVELREGVKRTAAWFHSSTSPHASVA
ncbi:MAG: NAD-dependent epimerase/dehydratase family protein [Gemmatimonadetes bacterium]|nr:NAD-dependent epimerase/dehydratase family protein [Gemmatimonadota bacterium]